MVRRYTPKNEDPYIVVSGRRPNDDSPYDLSLSLKSWEEWLSMDISLVNIDHIEPIEVLARILREMTSSGFDQVTIEKFRTRLQRKLEELDEESESIMKANRPN